MAESVSSAKMNELLEWAYDKAVQGLPGMGTAIELAEDYLSEKGTIREKINSLIRWQNTKAGSAGFIAGMGGLITLPVAVPANIASTLYVQIRMIAAIAHMAGHDIKHDKVKTLIFLCLLGNSMNEIAKDFGISFGTKFATTYIQKKISAEMLKKINQAVGFRLVTKAGSTGLINLTKTVPLLGGVIGGGMDAISTNIVGNQARNIFLKIDKIKSEKDFIEVDKLLTKPNKKDIFDNYPNNNWHTDTDKSKQDFKGNVYL